MVAPFYGATQPFPKQVLNKPFAPMEDHSSKQHNHFHAFSWDKRVA